MSILSLFITTDSVWKWLHRLGGPGLILLGIADNAPFISDVMKAAMPPRLPLNWRWSSLAGPSG